MTVPSSHRGVAEGLRQKGLTDADRPNKEHVLVAVNEIQGEDGIHKTALHSYPGCPVEILQAADLLETRLLKVHFQVTVITPGYLVSEDYL